MTEPMILAIDQGTSSTKAVLFDAAGRIMVKAACSLTSCFPEPGFVEQEPEDIYQSVLGAVRQCLESFRIRYGREARPVICGLSNQRETFLLWDRTGRPYGRAVVWQCKRSVGFCRGLKNTDAEELIRQRTGLIVDPYFSGTKLMWLCENEPRLRSAIRAGEIFFGTVDTWLLYRLTGGKRYTTDYTNASRTLFFNINTLSWDADLLERLGLTGLNLPEAKPSSGEFGRTDFEGLLREPLRIGAMIGDSHAAAFGEGCFEAGTAKMTLGTGCSILLNTERTRAVSRQGMVTTICWSTPGRTDYALEGVIVTCGATIQWLRDQIGLFAESRQTEAMALEAGGNNGVCLVPAFSGMGTPYWRMDLRAAILGLTFGCGKQHIVRAALESIAFQINDVLAAMKADSGIVPAELNADRGITANSFVMQFTADLLGIPVSTIGMEEASALGAALLAGLHAEVYSGIDALKTLRRPGRVYTPGPGRAQAQRAYAQYQQGLRWLMKETKTASE